jgi:hypothetical protein
LELNQVINSVIEDLKKDDIFILDLSEEEIIAKINEKSGTISTISTISLLECTADVKNFNQSINYAEWDSSY